MANSENHKREKLFTHQGPSIFFLLALSANIVVASGEREVCPNFCDCFFLYGLKWADCRGHRLYSVQTGVDENVQALDLSNNSISSLANYELRDSHLTRLKLLNLSSNAINEIGLNAFVDLSELRVLDLSKNHLYQILTDTFVACEKLEILDLSRNHLNHHVPKLRSSSITSLNLSKCGISHLPSGTFDDLPSLRSLDISDNVMIQLDPEILDQLTNLRILKIDGNPWTCNREMYELQERLRSRRINFKRVCDSSKTSNNSPEKFQKMMINDHSGMTKNRGRLSGEKWGNSKIKTSSVVKCRSPISATQVPGDHSNLSLISPYLFLAIGFLLGSATSTVFTYIWLSRRITNIASEQTSDSITSRSMDIDNDNQRANLLQHLWQNNQDDTIRPRNDCPGTPPPPYRDVMLNSNHYPRANV